jgi:hypothetical protein
MVNKIGSELFTMDEQELREKLEKSLGTRITESEWLHLVEGGVRSDYAEESWSEFRDLVREQLHRLERFLENTRQEEAGEMPSTRGETVRPLVETPKATVDESKLDSRTRARADAISALDRLLQGPKAWGGPSPWGKPELARRIIEPHIEPVTFGDGRPPRWVIRLQIEAWVPPDEVKRVYADLQSKLLKNHAASKTQALAYDVARFVWGQVLAHGERPPWTKLREWWNERHPEEKKQFKHYRTFRTYYQRGKKATPVRYVHTDEEIVTMARELKELRENPPDIGLRPPPPLA